MASEASCMCQPVAAANQPDVWASTVKQALTLFEKLFESHDIRTQSKRKSDASEEDDEIILDPE